MPSTRQFRLALAAIAAVAGVAVAIGYSTPRDAVFLPGEVAADRFVIVSSPNDLPIGTRGALAEQLGERALRMAAVGRPFNWGDVVDESLPYYRLVCGAVGRKYVVVQVEEGGFSPAIHTVVFRRRFWRSHAVWSGAGAALREPSECVSAIKQGKLWAGASARPPS